LSSFFALPILRQSGDRLTHEAVVNKLDDETVSYEVGLGIASGFSDLLRLSIKVETQSYESAVAWLRDCIYGAEFDKSRQVNAYVVPFCIFDLFLGSKSRLRRSSNLYQK
jgi:hypothetical protein